MLVVGGIHVGAQLVSRLWNLLSTRSETVVQRYSPKAASKISATQLLRCHGLRRQ